MKVAVLDHGMGNLRSVAKALEVAGAEVTVTADAATIDRSDGLCVPGQGIFGRCMSNLRDTGLDEVVTGWVASERPYLGICLGMQVLFETSDERGPVPGLGLFGGRVARLPASVRVPHIGWNDVNGASRADYFYFDHSYAVQPREESIVTGWCVHGDRFAARVEAGPLLAVQFHPEKSASAGLGLLKAWVES